MTDTHSREIGQYTVAHLFADHGVECEVLTRLGYVVRFTIDPKPSSFDDQTVQIDLMKRMPSGLFDLAVLHPNCGDVADLTSISGDRDEQEFQIKRAREIGQRIADDYIIENKPRDELRDPVVLNGRMFGLPIKYERAFETSFPVKSPPRERELGEKTVTPYYYSDRSIEWWKQVKGYSGEYPKEHLAKNALPAVYVETIVRSWLETAGRDATEPQDNNSPAPREVTEDQTTLVPDGETARPEHEVSQ